MKISLYFTRLKGISTTMPIIFVLLTFIQLRATAQNLALDFVNLELRQLFSPLDKPDPVQIKATRGILSDPDAQYQIKPAL